MPEKLCLQEDYQKSSTNFNVKGKDPEVGHEHFRHSSAKTEIIFGQMYIEEKNRLC